MPLNLPFPAPLSRILNEHLFRFEPCAQPWRVLACRKELRTVEHQVTFAGAFSRQAQAVAKFELGLEEVEERFGGGTGDAGTVGERLLVLATDLGIRDACVDHGHIRAAVLYMRVIGVPPAIGRYGCGFSCREVVVFVPCLIRHQRGPELAAITLGHPLLDEYLAFVAARARINTWLAVASDLKIFFGVVAKEPTEVTAADVFAFLAEQRKPRLGDRLCRGFQA